MIPPHSKHSPVSVGPLLLVALAALALLSPLYLHHARRTRFDASMQVFLDADERTRGSFEKLESVMSTRIACMVLLRLDGIFSEEGARLVDEVGRALLDLEGLPRVFSLTRAERPVRSDGFSLDLRSMVEFRPFLPLEPRSGEEWARLEALVTDYPWARDLLVSRDGRWTMLVAEVERPLEDHEQRVALRDEVRAALAPFEQRVEQLHVGAFPFIDVDIREAIVADAWRFALLLPLLLAAILLVTYRSPTVLLCVLVFQLLAIGALPVLFAWNGDPVHLFSALLFPLVSGLQLTFLTHLLSALKASEEHCEGFGPALAAALRRVLRPSVVAAVTSVIGLLSLLVCDVGLVRDFGRLGSQAVVAVFLLTFGPTWLLARWLDRGRPPVVVPMSAEPAWTTRLGPLVGLLTGRAGLVVGGMGLLVLAAIPALGHLRTDLRAIEFLDPESPSRRAMGAIDEHMGGMNLLEIEVDCGERDGIQHAGNLAFLERLERFAVGLPGVTNVYGYAQIFAMLNQIWERDAPGSRHVPTSPALIAAMGMVVHGQDFLFEESFYDPEKRRTTLFVRTRDMPAERYLSLVERILEWGEEQAPAGVVVQGRAGLHSVLESDRRIVASQVQSLGLCVLSVFLTLCLLWRSPRLALVALGVNLVPLAAVMALHGYAGIPLNSVTVMVGAVVLGIAVDDGIHLLSYWADLRRGGGNGGDAQPAEVLRRVLARKLVPMACTTAVLVSGLSLLLFSSFPPVADFGRLSVMALGVALVSTTLGAPAALWLAFGRTRVPGPRAHGARATVEG